MNREYLLNEIAWFAAPLIDVASTKEQLVSFFKEFGYEVDPADEDSIFEALGGFVNSVSSIVKNLGDGGNKDESINPEDLLTFFQAIRLLGDNTTIKKYFATNFLEEIFEYLLFHYLTTTKPFTFALLNVFGIVERKPIDETVRDLAYKKIDFKWSRFNEFINENQQWAKEVYGWNADSNEGDEKSLDYKLLFNALTLVIESGGYSLVYANKLEESDTTGFVSNIPEGHELWGFTLPLLQKSLNSIDEDGTPIFANEAGFKILPFGDYNVQKNLGIALTPYIRGEITGVQELDDNIFLKTDVSGQVLGGRYITITPVGISNQSGTHISAGFKIELTYSEQKDNTPIPIITVNETSKLEVDSLKFSLGGNIKGEFYVSGGVENIHAILDLGANSFLENFISEPININVGDIFAKWQSNKGVTLEGGNNVAIIIPVHIDLGPLKVSAIGLQIGLSDDTYFVFDITGGINLGPIVASVEEIGIKAIIKEKDKGLLGKYDLNLNFKPPKGIGIAVDAGLVVGGGYLYFDVDREEYAGALELVFSEWISLKAIGLITTKLPDGSKGFSMLIIITVEFGSGIQLGFGFTLLGVGGLLGINRIVNIEPLKDGIRTGAIESVMFPKDVIANAPRIISDLRKFFPPQNDLFLIGPMAKIGYGSPNLISLSMGIILEIPSINITIFGVLKLVLPDEETEVLRIQVNFIGRIEPSNNLLWFYAELFDSRVLFITLEGGMGLLVNWGHNANFVLSVGGFHPKYNPPPLPFPKPPRLALSILNEPNAKIRVEAYFAVTSNSVQFGAKAELFFGEGDFGIKGFLAFDALFQFDPFYFSFSLSLRLSVKVFGVGLFSVGFSGLLEGPTPWFIEGKGKISILFFSISVPFEHTWGHKEDTKLDPIEVFPLLEKEFDALTNWRAVLPKHSNIAVSLKKLGESDEDQLVLHPVGTLQISQRKIPLNFRLDKVGNQRPSDVNMLTLEAFVNGSNLGGTVIEDRFAIGQFKDLNDSRKLSSPAFEPLDSGIEIAVEGEQIKTSQAVKRVIRYESIIIDNNYKRFVKPFFQFFATGFTVLYEFLFEHFMPGNAVTKSDLSFHHKKRMQPFDQVIEIKPHEYSVAFNTNNKPMDVESTSFTSQAKATQFMEQQIQQDPKLTDKIHVIPNTEINIAA